MKNRLPLFAFALSMLAGCARTPGEIIYTGAHLARLKQCNEVPLMARQQCLDKLEHNLKESREAAEEERWRRNPDRETAPSRSKLEQAMRDGDDNP